jgi:WD40 repeat protein
MTCLDVQTGETEQTPGARQSNREGFSRLTDGQYVLVAHRNEAGDNAVKLIDWTSGELWQRFDHANDWITAAALSPDGQRVLTGDQHGRLRLWNARTAEVLREFEAGSDQVETVCFSADGRLVAFGGANWRVHLWDLQWEGEAPVAWDAGKSSP